ncbi:MAG: class II aldolase/adducin family protein, partial [Nitrospirota bacterium]|nr:class II aldolase/adducin family protein [Nitrospirota bacterium]
MNNKIHEARRIKALLVKHAKRSFSLGLVRGTGGNMSVRLDAESFFITATGRSLGDMTARDIVLCRTDKDSDCKNASMEWMLHSRIYRSRKDVNAVFHSQPPYSTLVACAKDRKIKTRLIPEAVAFLEHIAVVPYHHAGSIELAEKCADAAKKADVLLLVNHGLVTTGPGIEDAVSRTLTFEFLCRLNVLSRTADME